MTKARAVRAAFCLLVALLATMWPGTAAFAHGLPDSSYYRSAITAIQPSIPGLVLAVTKAGESLTLTNQTGKTVIVIGYAGEDYLRITPTGVDENIASLSSSLNGSLIIEGLPQKQDQQNQQRPKWRHVSDRPTFTWHDHRIHWMASQRPPVVARDPHHAHKVFTWKIPLTVNGQPVTVHGELDWKGSPGLTTFVIVLIVVGVASGAVMAVAIAASMRKEYLATRPTAEPDPPADAPDVPPDSHTWPQPSGPERQQPRSGQQAR
jgi:hypothetical protein